MKIKKGQLIKIINAEVGATGANGYEGMVLGSEQEQIYHNHGIDSRKNGNLYVHIDNNKYGINIWNIGIKSKIKILRDKPEWNEENNED